MFVKHKILAFGTGLSCGIIIGFDFNLNLNRYAANNDVVPQTYQNSPGISTSTTPKTLFQKVLDFQADFSAGRYDKIFRHEYHFFYRNVLDEICSKYGLTML